MIDSDQKDHQPFQSGFICCKILIGALVHDIIMYLHPGPSLLIRTEHLGPHRGIRFA